ncbi:MAG: ribonuclease R [Verrucomicrobia bacterium]|nr:ribonuclease R [Verrucomicrobiota bacterium]MCG2680521.1 ribonuclease R [Kiritimatiellia bacterium]MBU4248244.1 ribonuclease R [Verrucomicrobiota bacterium]MBU4290447.1 ribonuclease R [Verrucomicrobiota bacterium]MBU4428589.1 ribonuclease R [Verrucomicrobiota bacterium]
MNIPKNFSEHFHDPILQALQKSAQQPLKEAQIAGKLGLRGGARKRLRLLLNAMEREGEIVRLHHDFYSLGEPADLVTGEMDVLRSGDGFVSPLDGSADIFVRRDSLGTAFPHDRVVVRLDPGQTAPVPGMRRTGKVIRILERSKKALTGTLKATQKFFYVVPIDPAYTQDFYVPDPKGGKVNDRVVIQFTEWQNRHVNPEAEIIEIIGPASNPSLDTLAIIRHYGLPDAFPPAAIREAEASPEFMEGPGPERRDFRDRFIFTIDPVTARDFDDALSLDTDAQGRRVLGVHIADVSHFVRPGTALDTEARKRGNSVYLPEVVIPMLPEQISNGLCSLRPDEDRLAFSALITFDAQGAPVHSEFYRSVIRSRLRLTYEQALAALESGSTTGFSEAGISPQALSTMRRIHELAQQMRARRFAQFALDLDIPEYEVVMGTDGMIADIRQNVNDISHQLIEECMVAANEAVDRELSNRSYELLRRVHEPPAPQKMEMLTAQLAEMGFRPGDLSKRKNMTAFLKSARGHPLEYDVKLAVLKSMKRALYSPESLGHFGLAKTYYAHFTSPIRRYPDLVVHRILAAELTRRRNPYGHGELKMLGDHCSDTEQVADAAEKTLLEIKKYRFLEQQLKLKKPVVYDAIVVRVKNFGMFVELTRLQIQGLVHVSTMSRGFIRYDNLKETLRDGNVTYAFGTRVKVLVTRVDFDKRQIDFALADSKPVTSALPLKERQGLPARSGRRGQWKPAYNASRSDAGRKRGRRR